MCEFEGKQKINCWPYSNLQLNLCWFSCNLRILNPYTNQAYLVAMETPTDIITSLWNLKRVEIYLTI